MKIICLFSITIGLLLIGCNSLYKSDEVISFIPGTYISSWKSDYSQSIDTLLIEPLMKQGSETFAITRRTRVSFLHSDRKRAPEYRIKHWTAYYNTINKTLEINNNGSILSFDPVNKEMKWGTSTYRKL